MGKKRSKDPDERLCSLKNWGSSEKLKARSDVGVITSLDLDSGRFEVFFVSLRGELKRAFIHWTEVQAFSIKKEERYSRIKHDLMTRVKTWKQERLNKMFDVLKKRRNE